MRASTAAPPCALALALACGGADDDLASGGAGPGGITVASSGPGSASTGGADGPDATGDGSTADASASASAGSQDPECPFTDGAADEDADGVANAADNCPCWENPAQLDFDADGVGNACDNPLLYNAVVDGGPLQTTVAALVEAEILGQTVVASCEFPIDMTVRSGEILVRPDDQGRAGVWFASLDFEDSGVRSCDIGAYGVVLVHLKVELTELHVESLDPFAVGFAFTPGDHGAGVLAGTTDAPQEIVVSGVFTVLESDNEALSAPGPTYLSEIPGVFAPAAITIDQGGDRLRGTWSAPEFVVFDQIVSASGVEVRLTGMTGALELRR